MPTDPKEEKASALPSVGLEALLAEAVDAWDGKGPPVVFSDWLARVRAALTRRAAPAGQQEAGARTRSAFEREAADLLCNIFAKQEDPDWVVDPVLLSFVASALGVEYANGWNAAIAEPAAAPPSAPQGGLAEKGLRADVDALNRACIEGQAREKRLATVLAALVVRTERMEKDMGLPPSLSVMAARGELGLDPERAAPPPSAEPAGDTVAIISAHEALRFLRSCVRSGEKLSAKDDAAIDSILARLNSGQPPARPPSPAGDTTPLAGTRWSHPGCTTNAEGGSMHTVECQLEMSDATPRGKIK